MTITIGSTITIHGVAYTVIGAIDSGARSTIYKLRLEQGPTSEYALKVFKPEVIALYTAHNYDPFACFELQQDKLKDIPAFAWIKHRHYIAPNDACVQTHPQLKHAILMPWLNGVPVNALRKQHTITPFNCMLIAMNILDSLHKLETAGYAHGDISNANVLIDMTTNTVHIIDIEEMYMPELHMPPTLANNQNGHAGYRFPHGNFQSWQSNADRFSSAVLLSEILLLNNSYVNTIAAEEAFFHTTNPSNDTEKQEYNSKIKLLITQFNLTYPDKINLLKRTLEAKTINNACPLAEWATLFIHGTGSIVTPTTINITVTTAAPPKPYDKTADSNNPVLMVFVLDISQSMYHVQTNRTRYIDIAFDTINKILTLLIRRSLSGEELYPRYHIAFMCYHRTTTNVFKRIIETNKHTQYNIDTTKNNKLERVRANYNMGIVPLNALKSFTFVPAMLDEVTTTGPNNPDGLTYMTTAFGELSKLLTNHIDQYIGSHPPYIFHISDGNNNEPSDNQHQQLLQYFEEISSLETSYGKALVSSLYLKPVGATVKTGITDETPITDDALKNLRTVSSVIPDKYRTQLYNATRLTYHEDAKFIFYADADGVGIEHSIILAKGTGS